MCDLVLGGDKILALADHIEANSAFAQVWDAEGKTLTPGLIDQHVHIGGAGGRYGYASRTPEVSIGELLACGTTTVVGLLGTDGLTRSLHALYAKAQSLEAEGMSAYMLTGYFGLDAPTLTGSIQSDLLLVDKVLGCKLAISDERSSYPTDLDLLRHMQQVRVGAHLGSKKGILHLHLGSLSSRMDALFRIVQDHEFPIENISPTHVARTLDLFEQGIAFAKLGGMIDITTGASQYTAPWKSVLYALEQGVPMAQMTFSSDGNTGLAKRDAQGEVVGFRRAPIHRNLQEVVSLIREAQIPVDQAFQLITSNPARNLGLAHKGRIGVGSDADLCAFDDQLQLIDVFAKGQQVMQDAKLRLTETFA